MIPNCWDEVQSCFPRIPLVLYVPYNLDTGITCDKFIPARRNRSLVLLGSRFGATKFSHVNVSAHPISGTKN